MYSKKKYLLKKNSPKKTIQTHTKWNKCQILNVSPYLTFIYTIFNIFPSYLY